MARAACTELGWTDHALLGECWGRNSSWGEKTLSQVPEEHWLLSTGQKPI